MNLEVHSRGKR